MNLNLRTRPARLVMALSIAAAAVSLSACAGGAERPTVDQLSTGIATIFEEAGQADILTDEQLNCVAEFFLDSEVSDQDLANIADGKDLQTSQEAKDLVTSTMQDSILECTA